MKQRVLLLAVLFILFFSLLSFTLLAGQKNRIQRKEEQLFHSREELVWAENRLREEEERINELSQRVGALKGGEPPRLILTFDDGPSPYTGEILDILKEQDVPALFFINGINVTSSRADLLRRAVEEGHIIGNHTYSHDYNRIYRNEEAFMEDFSKNEDLIWDCTGTRSMLVRFPGGSRNSICETREGEKLMNDLKELMDRRGYLYMDWNVTENSSDPRELLQSLEEQIIWRDSATILLHDRGDRAVLPEILPQLIEDMKEAGYQFVVPEPSAGMVRF